MTIDSTVFKHYTQWQQALPQRSEELQTLAQDEAALSDSFYRFL